MSNVQLRGVRKSFGGVEVVKGVDLDVGDREFVVIVGPSGCGKSTLLRLIAGLEDVTSGDLVVDGARINGTPAAQRGFAMVFQSYALYPHMTVFDNMAFGLRTAGVDRTTVRQKIAEAARILQLEELLQRKPRQLSGGQRQRVAIGRAIVRNPRLFLFDEPLSNLDAALRVQMRIELARLRRQLDATMVYVTHDQVEAMTLADKIVVLNAGRVEQVGTPLELYRRPVNIFVAGFIGSPKMNFLDGKVVNNGAEAAIADGAVIRLPEALPAGSKVTVGIRPEHIRLPAGPGDASLTGTPVVVERLGGETFVYLHLPAGPVLTVRAAGGIEVKPGETVAAGIPGELCYLFDADGRSLRV